MLGRLYGTLYGHLHHFEVQRFFVVDSRSHKDVFWDNGEFLDR